jgi:hypothetical protein
MYVSLKHTYTFWTTASAPWRGAVKLTHMHVYRYVIINYTYIWSSWRSSLKGSCPADSRSTAQPWTAPAWKWTRYLLWIYAQIRLASVCYYDVLIRMTHIGRAFVRVSGIKIFNAWVRITQGVSVCQYFSLRTFAFVCTFAFTFVSTFAFTYAFAFKLGFVSAFAFAFVWAFKLGFVSAFAFTLVWAFKLGFVSACTCASQATKMV